MHPFSQPESNSKFAPEKSCLKHHPFILGQATPIFRALFLIGDPSSNGCFSIAMLVLGGVVHEFKLKSLVNRVNSLG